MEVRMLRNKRGQGLIEYLIIVALMAVATIAVVRTMGGAVNTRFKSITKSIQSLGNSKARRSSENNDSGSNYNDFGRNFKNSGGMAEFFGGSGYAQDD
jgi:pilus assembly protein Flp/PilA